MINDFNVFLDEINKNSFEPYSIDIKNNFNFLIEKYKSYVDFDCNFYSDTINFCLQITNKLPMNLRIYSVNKNNLFKRDIHNFMNKMQTEKFIEIIPNSIVNVKAIATSTIAYNYFSLEKTEKVIVNFEDVFDVIKVKIKHYVSNIGNFIEIIAHVQKDKIVSSDSCRFVICQEPNSKPPQTIPSSYPSHEITHNPLFSFSSIHNKILYEFDINYIKETIHDFNIIDWKTIFSIPEVDNHIKNIFKKWNIYNKSLKYLKNKYCEMFILKGDW